jgi:carboxylesterase type B
MGAYGFLAGRSAERENATNLAFYDQRSALEWTQSFIGLFGGDPNKVTAAGESAGAGSIMHHMYEPFTPLWHSTLFISNMSISTAFGGKQDPLFRKAIVQSPAFVPSIDRDGYLEDTFKLFEKNAGCAGQGFSCLRSASNDEIKKANDATIRAAPPGSFAFGPAADGKWSRQMPSLELYTGNFFKGLDSLIVSHTSNESYMFADPAIKTQQDLDVWQKKLLPTDPRVQSLVEARFAKFPYVQKKLSDLIQGLAFTCNVRYFTQSFPGKTYNMQYSKGKGTHGSDILSTFYSKQSPLTDLVGVINSDIPPIGRKLQAYFASYVITGDPNAIPEPFTPTLLNPFRGKALEMTKPANPEASMIVVLDISSGESYVPDLATSAEQCDTWSDGLAVVTNVLGYAAPGAVRQGSVPVSNASEFYFVPRPSGQTAT